MRSVVLFLLLSLYLQNLWSADIPELFVRLGQQKLLIRHSPQGPGYFSLDCYLPDGALNLCLAGVAMKRLKRWKHNEDLEFVGGQNPGSVLCTEFLQGHSLIANFMDRGPLTICQFSDDSFVSVDVIYFFMNREEQINSLWTKNE